MQVNPVYAAVGTVFQNQPLLRVPKYQRGYAWEKEEIDDFLGDLEKVYNSRKGGKPQNHFLGGIVSVQRPIMGTVQKFEYELVDGQQRIATFVLLANAIILNYKKIVAQAEKNGDTNNLSITNKRIDKLIPRYLQFEQETNRNIAIENVLKLSKTDDTFFSALIHSSNPAVDRDSHKRLKYAFDKINKKVEILTESQDINVYLDNLEILEQNIDDDFTILHIVTQDKKEAYTLFQVLNDRRSLR